MRGTADASTAGTRSCAGSEFRDVTRSDVAQTFGEDFAALDRQLRAGRLEGPVTSAYGTHLVRVSERVEARDPRSRRSATRRGGNGCTPARVAANEALYEKLRSRYVIKVEDRPAPRRRQLAEAAP